MTWTEGFSNSNYILSAIGKAICMPVDENGIFHPEDAWELVYPDPSKFAKVTSITESLFTTDQVTYKTSKRPIKEGSTPELTVNGNPPEAGTYVIDFTSGIVTFYTKLAPSDVVTLTYDWDDNGIEGALAAIGTGIDKDYERVIFKTTTYPVTITPEERLQNDIIDPSLNEETITMYLELYKPKYLVNPETGLESYKDIHGTTISTSRNQHYIMARVFENYVDIVQVLNETAVPDKEYKVYTLANKRIVNTAENSPLVRRNGVLLGEGSGDTITVDGVTLQSGIHFMVGDTLTETAANLAVAIEAEGNYTASVNDATITLTQVVPSADMLTVTMDVDAVGAISEVTNTVPYSAAVPAKPAVKTASNAPANNIDYGTQYSGQSLTLNGKTVLLTNVLLLDGSATPLTMNQIQTALQADIDVAYPGTTGTEKFTVSNDGTKFSITSSSTGATAVVNLNGSSPGIAGILGFTDLTAVYGTNGVAAVPAEFQFSIVTNFAPGDYQLDPIAGTIIFPVANQPEDVIVVDYSYNHNGPVPDKLDAYGNVIERGAHVSDWAKFSWFRDWEEVNRVLEGNSVSAGALAEGLFIREIEIPNLVDGIPIQFWLSVNRDRLILVLMGEPSIDVENYICSFGYFGKLGKLPKSVNDTAGNFALTVGSSTVPAMLGTVPRERAVITKVTADTNLGGNHEGDYTYSYIVTFVTDGGESAACDPMAVYAEGSPDVTNIAIKVEFKTPLYAKGWRIYRYKIAGDATQDTNALSNLNNYQLIARSSDTGGIKTWIDADATAQTTPSIPSFYGTPTPGVVRDPLFGIVKEVKYSNKWGFDTATGVTDIAMFKTRGGAFFQRHRVAFTTPEEFMSKNAFNPSRWTGHFHLSLINVVHTYDGYRGVLDGVLAVDSTSIAPLDELIVDKGKVEITEKAIKDVYLPLGTGSIVFNDFSAEAQTMKIVGKLPNTLPQASSESEQVGVLIDSPFNKVTLRTTDGQPIKDDQTREIYGRMSWDVDNNCFRIDLKSIDSVTGNEVNVAVSVDTENVVLNYNMRENVEKYYKYFTINAPHSVLTNGPNAMYGLAIRKN